MGVDQVAMNHGSYRICVAIVGVYVTVTQSIKLHFNTGRLPHALHNSQVDLLIAMKTL